VTSKGEGRGVYRDFVGRPENKIPLERHGIFGLINVSKGDRDLTGELDSVGSIQGLVAVFC
jgi:hypothetical protein